MADINPDNFQETLDKLAKQIELFSRVMAKGAKDTEGSSAKFNKYELGFGNGIFRLGTSAQDLADTLTRASNNANSDANTMFVKFRKGMVGFDDFTKHVMDSRKELNDYKKQIEVLEEVASRASGEELEAVMNNIAALQEASNNLQTMQQGLALTKDRFKDLALGTLKATFSLENMGKALNETAKHALNVFSDALSGDPFGPVKTGFNAGVEVLNKGVQATTKGIGAVGASLAMIPGPIGLVGAALAVLAPLVGGVSEAVSKLAQEGFSLMLEQAKKMIGNFDKLNQSGLIAAGGLTEMRNMAGKSGLTLEQFTKVTTQSADKLITIGGTVASGAQKMTNTVGNFSDTTKRQLMNLGYSFEDITEGTVDYMESMKLAGQLDKMTSAEQAAGAKDYLVNQRLLTSITGEEAKAAQKRAKEAANQAAVQAKLATMDADSRQKYEALVKAAGPGNQKAVEQLFLFGSVTGDAAIALSGMPSMMKYLQEGVAAVGDSSVNASQQVNMLRDNQLKYGQSIGEESQRLGAALGTSASAVGAFEASAKMAAEGQIFAARAQGKTADELRTTAEAGMNTQDQATDSLNKARVNAQNLAVSLEEMVTKALPQFGKIANTILESYKDVFDAIRKVIGTSTTVRTDNRGNVDSRPIGFGPGQRAPITREDYELIQRQRNAERASGPSAAMGGVVSGSSQGYNATLHGVEAIVPLPDSRSIPVELTGIRELMGQSAINNNTGMADLAKTLTDQMAVQTDKFNDMIRIMQRTASYTGQLADNTL